MNTEINRARKLKRAVVKEEFIALTGNHIDALLLNQFLYWRERVDDFDELLEEEQKFLTTEEEDAVCEKLKKNGWIYKSAKDLSEEIMVSLAPSNMRVHIKNLIRLGYIEERNNPKYRWDKKKQYRVNLKKVIDDLLDKGYYLEGYKLPLAAFSKIKARFSKTENGISKSKNQNSESNNQTKQNNTAILQITNIDYNNNSQTGNMSDLFLNDNKRKDIYIPEVHFCPNCQKNEKHYELTWDEGKKTYHCSICQKSFSQDLKEIKKPKETDPRIGDLIKYVSQNHPEQPYIVNGSLLGGGFKTLLKKYDEAGYNGTASEMIKKSLSNFFQSTYPLERGCPMQLFFKQPNSYRRAIVQQDNRKQTNEERLRAGELR